MSNYPLVTQNEEEQFLLSTFRDTDRISQMLILRVSLRNWVYESQRELKAEPIPKKKDIPEYLKLV